MPAPMERRVHPIACLCSVYFATESHIDCICYYCIPVHHGAHKTNKSRGLPLLPRQARNAAGDGHGAGGGGDDAGDDDGSSAVVIVTAAVGVFI